MTIKTSCYYFLMITIGMVFNACHLKNGTKGSSLNGSAAYHMGYDDSTMNIKTAPMLMPYNRLIDPAGSTVIYGDLKVENHSLDCKLLSGESLLAVEDRFGIAMLDIGTKKIVARWAYADDRAYNGVMSTYSGMAVVQRDGKTTILWGAANGSKSSYIMVANWEGGHLILKKAIPLKGEGQLPLALALPNELYVASENGVDYVYAVLNGNNQLVKIDLASGDIKWKAPVGVAPYGMAVVGNQAFVTNWGGPVPNDTLRHEVAGVPYSPAYTDHRTGAIVEGTVTVVDMNTGKPVKEISVGLHPNVIINSPDKRYLYVANGNSDNVYVLDAQKMAVVDSIDVMLDAGSKGFIGDSPNALALSPDGTTLYVANGLDNAVAVVKLGANIAANGKGKTAITGFIPTEAYPGGLAAGANQLYVTNLEGEGARVNRKRISGEPRAAKDGDEPDAFNSHHQEATLSLIPLPQPAELTGYTDRVHKLNLQFRSQLARQLPRSGMAPKPVPDRIGEPSVFKHVIYIIKENRTYDQVLGDMAEGNGARQLCIYGDSITPNQHRLAKNYVLLDNYYASGKSSAEGHQWTDAAMVTDYVEKSVRAWFRSYPHVQTDAMVYDKQGFIWNNALDHGKSVRIYGEAATPEFDVKLTWASIYQNWKEGKPFVFSNFSTINRVRPLLAPGYPGYDTHVINDQIRADAFIKELKAYEAKPGDQWPELMVLALPADHTGGLSPRLPTPRAMVADNDLALGRIVEAVSHSRFYSNTVIFVTEDDSQDGWDHVSAYRTTGNVISPYSRLQREVHTNYNQTCIVRTIEQILGIPPMNTIDATALPMFDCFNNTADVKFAYQHLENRIPLNEMNKSLSTLKGIELYYAKTSMLPAYAHIDGGNDDLLNRMLWYSAKGKKVYPAKLAGKGGDD